MFILYSDNPSPEIEITVNKNDLLELSEKIIEDNAEINAIVLAKSKAAPYDRFLSGIKVMLLPDKLVEFQVTQDDKLSLQGSLDKMSILSDNFLSASQADDDYFDLGKHEHIDYFPEHFYLSPNSIPVVIMFGTHISPPKLSQGTVKPEK